MPARSTPSQEKRLERARSYSAQVDGDALLVWSDFDVPPTPEEVIAIPIACGPGAGFRCGPTSTQLLGTVIERKSGSRPVFKEELFLPLAIPKGRWSYAGDEVNAHTPRGLLACVFGGAQRTAREPLRIGRLLLQDGCWKGMVFWDRLAGGNRMGARSVRGVPANSVGRPSSVLGPLVK